MLIKILTLRMNKLAVNGIIALTAIYSSIIGLHIGSCVVSGVVPDYNSIIEILTQFFIACTLLCITWLGIGTASILWEPTLTEVFKKRIPYTTVPPLMTSVWTTLFGSIAYILILIKH